MRAALQLTIICIMQIVTYINATTGKYTIIAPGTIHCNEKYTAAVAVHHIVQPCQIKIGITGPSYNKTKQVKVTHNKVKNVDFVMPCLKNGDYSLTAEGIDCLDNFKNTTKLIYNKFHNHLRLQTDKNFYAPGEDINFRVLFLDKDLRPAQPENDTVIWFTDGKRNRVKEIRDFKTIKGVYSGKFKISEFPVTGGWHLSVRNGDKFVRTIHFKVDKYVSPKFIVRVKASKSVSVKDGEMQVVVRAYYNYGEPLEGKVSVLLFFESVDYSKKTKPPIVAKTGEVVKGKAKLDLNIKEYKAYLPYKNARSYMTIVATVEEPFTGVKINGTASTVIYPYRYYINCINYDAYATFGVDKEKDAVLQITNIDGSYPKDTKSTIELIYKEVLRQSRSGGHRENTSHYDNPVVTPMSQNRTISFKGHMNETGFVNFKVALPVLPEYQGYLHYYSLELKYLDEQREVCSTHQYWELKRFKSPEIEEVEQQKEYFVLENKYWFAEKLYIKMASHFTLNSSQPLSYFDYSVIGRGNIMKTERVILHNKPKVYNLTLTPQFSWAPSFCLYVNYVDENGKYYFAEQSYKVVLELENQINVTVAKLIQPGKDVTFKIQTAPNSFVGLMAIDHSAFLSRPDNDLNLYELDAILDSFNTFTYRQAGYSEIPGEMSGCVTLTNADYFYSWNQHKNIKRNLMLPASMYSTTGEAADFSYWKASKTWFFADIENTDTAEFVWTIKIPKTVASWALTAFSLNTEKGLGVSKEETKITTFLPFFITIRVPYSVKRGEVVSVPALVFNYLDKTLAVEIALHNSDDEYEFMEFGKEVGNKQKLSKTIHVPANEAAGISFLIKPKVVGNVLLKFNAISPVASDTIHKSMNVVLEGITVYVNRVFYVNLNKLANFKSSFQLELPKDLIPDSERVEVGVMGDILGPVLNNLENLVRLPTGFGEATMSALLPSYLVLKYLKDSKRLTRTIETKLRHNLETGYQNILYYRHKDGSFSSFGPSQILEKPRNGCTWLTAYVVRSLQQMKEFIHVDNKIIEKGLVYLTQQQALNGTFTEKGDFFYDSHRKHVTLTTVAVLAIMENDTYAKKYSDELNKGFEFIAQNIGKSESLHTQAIGTFILNKARHARAKDKVAKLWALAKNGENRIWWSSKNQQCGHRWWGNVFSNDVEITSYVLLSLLDQESTKIDDVLPIINWLVAQRNSYGGFASTQATLLGLTALIEFAEFTDYEQAQMAVDIEAKEKKETISVTEDNRILYQNIEMSPKTKSIQFSAKGTGSALVQIAYQYNIFEKDLKPSFSIKAAKVENKNKPLHLEMLVCVRYVGEGDSSYMALLEISTPSGYVIDEESLKDIKELKRVSVSIFKLKIY